MGPSFQPSELMPEYVRPFVEAFSDIDYEFLHRHESRKCAIDEGFNRRHSQRSTDHADGGKRPAYASRMRP